MHAFSQIFRNWGSHLGANNPLLLKEFRGRMRGNRAGIILSIYLGLMAILLLIVYSLYISTGNYYQVERQVAGKLVFGTVTSLEFLLISLIAPALTSTSISAERDHQTFDLLRTTLLRARSIVLGKLGSAIIFVLLLIVAGLPFHALALLLGGVAPSEVIISILMLLVTTLTFGSLGIWFSALIRRSLASSIVSYVVTLLLFYVFPSIFATVLLSGTAVLFGGYSSSNYLQQVITIILIGITLCLNPVSAGITSEIFLLENQELWFISLPLNNGTTLYLPSPWWIYLIIFSLFSLFFILLAIRLVNRIEK